MSESCAPPPPTSARPAMKMPDSSASYGPSQSRLPPSRNREPRLKPPSGSSESRTGLGDHVEEVVEQLEGVVNILDLARLGALTKTQAMLKIVSIFKPGDNGVQGEAELISACEQYFQRIEDSIHVGAHVQRSPQRRGDGLPSTQEPSDEDTSSTNGNDYSRKEKRENKLSESDMPWYAKDEGLANSQFRSRGQDETRRIINLLARDPKAAKRFLVFSPSSLPDFPSSEFEAIIQGEPVCIDTVFSALHPSHVGVFQPEVVVHLGDSEIRLAKPKPARKVKTSLDWTLAYEQLADATTLVFPHRRAEFTWYGSYIRQQFNSKPQELHGGVISYDAAVRGYVRGGQSILLTDCSAYSHLYLAFLSPFGIEYPISSSPSTARDNRKTLKYRPDYKRDDPCMRFNRGVCPYSSDNCHYCHACTQCGKSDHGRNDCHKVRTGSNRHQLK